MVQTLNYVQNIVIARLNDHGHLSLQIKKFNLWIG